MKTIMTNPIKKVYFSTYKASPSFRTPFSNMPTHTRLYLASQAIAISPYGFKNKSIHLFFTQSLHKMVDIPVRAGKIVSPHFIQQSFPRTRTIDILHHVKKELKFLCGYLNFASFPNHPVFVFKKIWSPGTEVSPVF